MIRGITATTLSFLQLELSEQRRKLWIHDDLKPIGMTQRRKSS